MSILVSNIINSAIHQEYETAFIFGTDGVYESCVAKLFKQSFTSANAFSDVRGIKSANRDNFTFVNKVPAFKNIDIVINADIDIFQRDSFNMFRGHTREIYIEHRYIERLKKEDVYLSKKLYEGKEIVFSSEEIKNDWQLEGRVIPRYAAINDTKPQEKTIDVLIYGNFEKHDYRLFHQLYGITSNVKVIGENPGLSRPVGYQELLDNIAQSKIFVSTTFGIYAAPFIEEASMLEAAVVTNAAEPTTMLEDGVNASIRLSPSDFTQAIKNILADETYRTRITKNAKEKFASYTEQDFTDKWRELIYG